MARSASSPAPDLLFGAPPRNDAIANVDATQEGCFSLRAVADAAAPAVPMLFDPYATRAPQVGPAHPPAYDADPYAQVSLTTPLPNLPPPPPRFSAAQVHVWYQSHTQTAYAAAMGVALVMQPSPAPALPHHGGTLHSDREDFSDTQSAVTEFERGGQVYVWYPSRNGAPKLFGSKRFYSRCSWDNLFWLMCRGSTTTLGGWFPFFLVLYEDGNGVLPCRGRDTGGDRCDTTTWYWRSRYLVRFKDLRNMDLIEGLSGRRNARRLGEWMYRLASGQRFINRVLWRLRDPRDEYANTLY